MSPDSFALYSGALTFGIPLALAAADLVAMRRRPRGGGGHRLPDPAPPRPPSQPASKPLPDCLIPKRDPNIRPVRDRELELI